MRELDKISDSLFNKIRARFDQVSIGDETAKKVTDPSQARFFNFDYVSEDGENFGNVTISLVDEDSLKIYFSSNITNALDEEQEAEWYLFLRNLRKFARRNMLAFDVRDINRSNLDLKDLKQQSKADSTFDKDELAIAESRLYGHGNNRRVSYGDVGTHKLIIKHKDQINLESHGARGRQIEHVFVETPLGERFLLPHTNLHGARATANHLRHGGRMDDEGSAIINEMVKEMASMRHFVRSMRNRTFEDQETTGMVEAAMHRYNEVRDHLKRFQGRKGHDLLIDMCGGADDNVDEEVDVDSLRERFVKKIYDDRFTEALPYVYRAYKNRQKTDTPMSVEFESWANEITEETWDSDTDDYDEADLQRLVQTPIAVGIDGADAIGAIRGINFLNNEELYSALQKQSLQQGPDADSRRTIAGWLASNGETALANLIIQVMQSQAQPTEPMPPQPTPEPQSYGASTMDEPVVQEGIMDLRKLAGLVKK
jgi:hypothetical protein